MFASRVMLMSAAIAAKSKSLYGSGGCAPHVQPMQLAP